MKFSIISASFNQVKWVDRCLRSVETQVGNVEIEHIILDNCSTDGTVDLLRAYEKRTTRAIVHLYVEPDAGQTAAINRGFSLATGDVVCWLNTDEWLESDALQSVAQSMQLHPGYDVYFGDCNFLNEAGSIVRRKREHFYSHAMLLFRGCYIQSCATFVRRRVIDDGIVLSPEFRVAMDYDWYVRIGVAGYRFAPLRKLLASFVWHDDNISTAMSARRIEEVLLIRDRYAGVRGAAWYRHLVYAVLRVAWRAVRVMRRAWERLLAIAAAPRSL